MITHCIWTVRMQNQKWRRTKGNNSPKSKIKSGAERKDTKNLKHVYIFIFFNLRMGFDTGNHGEIENLNETFQECVGTELTSIFKISHGRGLLPISWCRFSNSPCFPASKSVFEMKNAQKYINLMEIQKFVFFWFQFFNFEKVSFLAYTLPIPSSELAYFRCPKFLILNFL